MRRKPITIASILLIMMLTVTSTFAITIRLSSVDFRLGSLIADGTVKGLSKNQTVTIVLDAKGTAKVVCIKDDDDDDEAYAHAAAAAHELPISARGSERIKANSKGVGEFEVETKDPKLTPAQAGCPHGDDWEVKILSESWTSAVITVKEGSTELLKQSFSCKTSGSDVDCKKKGGDDDDDD